MESGLNACARLPGVSGAFVSDNGGEVVATSSPPPLATDSMSRIAREMIRAFAALQAGGRPAVAIQCDFHSWSLHARDLGGTSVLIIVAEPEVNASMVRMTAEVTCREWQADKKVAKQLAARPTARTQLVTRGQLDEISTRSWTAFAGA